MIPLINLLVNLLSRKVLSFIALVMVFVLSVMAMQNANYYTIAIVVFFALFVFMPLVLGKHDASTG